MYNVIIIYTKLNTDFLSNILNSKESNIINKLNGYINSIFYL